MIAANAPANFQRGSGGLQQVSAAVARASLRFDIAWQRRPRLFGALLSIAGVPALCLCGAGASIYLAEQGAELGILLLVTMPLAVLALTVGSRRRRLAAEFDPWKIATRRSLVPVEAWQALGDDVRANAARWFTGPATLSNILFWLDGPRWSAGHTRRERIKAAQLEAFSG